MKNDIPFTIQTYITNIQEKLSNLTPNQTVMLIFVLTVIALVIFSITVSLLRKKSYKESINNIVSMASFIDIVSNKQDYEIYTKQGRIRVSIQKMIDKRKHDYFVFLRSNYEEYKEVLYTKRLIDKKWNIKQNNIKKAAGELRYLYGSSVRSVKKTSKLNGAMSVSDFFLLKQESKGDNVGVYVLHNKTRDKYYVGQAKRLLFRVNQHFTGAGKREVYKDYLAGDEFHIQLNKLVNSGYSDLDKFEKDMIEKYDAYRSGYNKTVGNG